MYTFDQWALFGIDSQYDWCNDYYTESQLLDDGHIYVPHACSSKSCRVHISFNRCGGSAEGYDGIIDYAATNDIIVVYPESECWNSNEDVPVTDTETYLTNTGLYPKFIKNVMCRVLNPVSNARFCESRNFDCYEGASAITSATIALIASLWLLQ